MLSLPLTGLPTFVLSNGAIRDSTFPGHHAHPFRNGFWVLNLMGGSGVIDMEGVRRSFSSGCAVLTPPAIWHTYHITRTVPFVHAHFRAFGDVVPVPMVVPLGARAAWARATLREAGRRLSAEPERAGAALWHLLWQLAAGPARAVDPIHHPVIAQVLEHLSRNLHLPVDPESLAQLTGVSVRHLNRLCTAAFAMPVAGYIREQRLQRARHLLEESEIPIISIARLVGYSDLQHFSKLMRQWSGASPRQIRHRRDVHS